MSYGPGILPCIGGLFGFYLTTHYSELMNDCRVIFTIRHRKHSRVEDGSENIFLCIVLLVALLVIWRKT